jgi:hypothetical protein
MNLDQANSSLKQSESTDLHVVPGSGSFQTIQEAINAASPGNRILVASTLYTQSILINKPNLTLEAREPSSEVQITRSQGPIITISLKDTENCTIKGFKLIHTAVSRKTLETSGNSAGKK